MSYFAYAAVSCRCCRHTLARRQRYATLRLKRCLPHTPLLYGHIDILMREVVECFIGEQSVSQNTRLFFDFHAFALFTTLRC